MKKTSNIEVLKINKCNQIPSDVLVKFLECCSRNTEAINLTNTCMLPVHDTIPKTLLSKAQSFGSFSLNKFRIAPTSPIWFITKCLTPKPARTHSREPVPKKRRWFPTHRETNTPQSSDINDRQVGNTSDRSDNPLEISSETPTEVNVLLDQDADIFNSIPGPSNEEHNEGGQSTTHQTAQLQINPFQYNKLNDEQFKYLTGHSKSEFDKLFDLVTQGKEQKDFRFTRIPLQEQLLLTLMKCRKDFDYFMLGIMFHLPDGQTVSDVFQFWLELLQKTVSRDFWSLVHGCT